MPDPESPSTRLIVELCAGGIEDVRLATRLNVDRIELNSGMAIGGLTPSAGLVASARSEFTGPIIAMVRPREGGFCYSESEFAQMLRDAEWLLNQGVDGIAVGFLTSTGTIDAVRSAKFRGEFPSTTIVCHKAFDATADLETSLMQLIDCGFDRVLTSGGMRTATLGANVICRLREIANRSIAILPGGGVRASDVVALIDQTGCDQFHSAVRAVGQDLSMQNCSSLHFGLAGEANGSFGLACEDQLKELLAAVADRRAS